MARAAFLRVLYVIGLVTCSVFAQDSTDSDTTGSSTLIVGAIEDPGYLTKREDGTYEGFHKDVLDEISRLTQLDYQIKAPDDGRYGIQQDDGTWLGMVGELVENQMDMALGLYTTTTRLRHIDFTKTVLEEHLEMVMRKPPRMRDWWWSSVYHVVSPSAFVIGCVSFLLVAVVMFVIIRVSPYESRGYSEEVGEASRLSTFGHSLWICYSAMSWQGVDYSPRSLSGRFLTVFWFGYIVWVLIMLTGAMAGFFVASRPAPMAPIDSFDELAASDDFRPAFVAGGAVEVFFENSQIPIYRHIYDKAFRVTSNDEGIKNVRTTGGWTVFIAPSTFTHYASSRKPCDLLAIHDAEGFTGRPIAIGLTKNSPWKDQLDLAILQLREDGILQRLYQKWFVERAECSSKRRQPEPLPFVQVSFREMIPVFIELVVAAILALCIMGIEVYLDKRRSKVPQKTTPPKETAGAHQDTNV